MNIDKVNQQKELVNKFYSCFQKKDFKGMIECYHPDIHFKDEVFDLQFYCSMFNICSFVW